MPGLINTHTHAPMVLYRGLGDDLALMDWLQKYIFPAEAKTVSPAFVRTGTHLAALEMIRSGTTTYVDMYYFEEEIARATKQAGLRGVLGQTIIEFPVPDAKTPADALAARRDVHPRVPEGRADRAGGGAARGVHARRRDADAHRATLPRRYGVPLVIHLAETEAETRLSLERHKARPVAALDALGVLEPHESLPRTASGSQPRGDRGAARQRRRRLAQSRKQHEAGERHGAGAGLSRGRGRARPRHRRRRQQQRSRHVRGDAPGGVSPQADLEGSASGERADRARDGDDRRRARDRPGEASWVRSKPGKLADLIVVRMDQPRQTPMYDPVSHLVYVTRGDDVETTIVNGRVLMRGGKSADAERAGGRCAAARQGRRSGPRRAFMRV